MAIADYGDLVTTAQRRSGIADFAQYADQWTGMAEVMLSKRLLVSNQEQMATLTPVPVSGAPYSAVAMPVGWQEIQEVVTDGDRPLARVPFKSFWTSRGLRRGFAIRGLELLSTEENIPHRVFFFGRVPSLAEADDGVSWLLAEEPELYLQSLLFQAYSANGDVEKMTETGLYLTNLIDAYKLSDRRRKHVKRRFSPEYKKP